MSDTNICDFFLNFDKYCSQKSKIVQEAILEIQNELAAKNLTLIEKIKGQAINNIPVKLQSFHFHIFLINT